MSIGRAYRKRFEAMMRLKGQTIVVHENFNTLEATYFEVKGLKDSENSRQVIFQFPEAAEIPVGAVLQVKGSRDYWKVTDTEDIMESGVFINFEARVEKINLVGEPTRPTPKAGDTFNLHGANSRVNIQSHDNSINISHQLTESVFADMRQVIQNQIQNEVEKTEILKNLEELEAAIGTSGFVQKYQNFIASAANHISLLSPFIPAITQMLSGG